MTARLLTTRPPPPPVPAPGSDIFTPPDVFEDTVTLSWSGSVWDVTQSDHASVVVGVTTFSDLNDAYGVIELLGPTTVILPAMTITEINIRLDQGSIAWQGQVDGNNDPTTVFGGAGRKFFCISADADARFMWKNCRFGRSAAEWAIDETFSDGEALRMNRPCEMIFDNCIWAGCKDYQVYVSQLSDENGMRARGKVLIYNSEQFGFGGVGSHHGMYLHALHTFRFSRSLSYNPQSTTHNIKLDGDRGEFLQSAVCRDIGLGSAPSLNNTPLQFTHATDFLALDSVFQHTGSGKEIISTNGRADTEGGASLKWQGPIDRTHQTQNWRSGPFWVLADSTTCTHFGGHPNTDYSAGAATITISQMCPAGKQNSGNYVTLDPLETYTVDIENDNGDIQTITSAATVISAGTATFTVGGAGLDFAVDGSNIMTVKISTAAYDHFIPNSDLFDDNKETWFDRNDDGTGQVDIANWKPSTSEPHVMQIRDCLFVAETAAVRGIATSGNGYLSGYLGGASGNSDASFPEGPIDNAAWAPVAGAGSGTPMFTNVSPAGFGESATATPWFFPHALICKDIAFVSINGGSFSNQFLISYTPKTALRNSGVEADVRWVDAGTLTRVVNTNQSPAPVPDATTFLSGAHAEGATTLTLVSNAGISPGMKLKVITDLKRGPEQCIYTTTVSTVDGGGFDVTVPDGLPSAFTGIKADTISGLVSAQVSAGATPNAFADLADYPI